MRNKKGNAMIVVMCVTCVFVFISLALLLAASVLISQAQHMGIDDRCRILSITFSKSLETQLSSPYEQLGIENNELRAWLRSGIGGDSGNVGDGDWAYYEEGEQGHEKVTAYRTLNFNLDTEDEVGDFKAELYWEFDITGGAKLYVTVTCIYKDRQQSITTQYELKKTNVTLENGANFSEWRWIEAWRS